MKRLLKRESFSYAMAIEFALCHAAARSVVGPLQKALMVVLFAVPFLAHAGPTNCCDGCTTNDYVSYNMLVQPGFNFLANSLCRGTNTTLNARPRA